MKRKSSESLYISLHKHEHHQMKGHNKNNKNKMRVNENGWYIKLFTIKTKIKMIKKAINGHEVSKGLIKMNDKQNET